LSESGNAFERHGIGAYLSTGTVSMVTLLLVTGGATHRAIWFAVMIRLKLQMARNFLPSEHCSLRTNMKLWHVLKWLYEPWEGRTGLWTDVARSQLTIQALSLTSTW